MNGILCKEGEVCYEDGCQLKLNEEFEKTIKYFDSIPILIGIEHPKSFNLNDVVGKANNFRITKEGWEGDFHFDTDKIKPEMLYELNNRDYIPASISDFVRMEGDEKGNIIHRDQVPVHLLVHPDLKPNIKGAGIKNNIRFSERKTEGIKMSEELKKENAELKANLEKLQENQIALENEVRATLIGSINGFDEEELQEKTIGELKTIIEVQKKFPKQKSNTAVEVEKSKVDFWSMYKEAKK